MILRIFSALFILFPGKTSRVNFINVLRAAFTRADPKCAKKDSQVNIYHMEVKRTLSSLHKEKDAEQLKNSLSFVSQSMQKLLFHKPHLLTVLYTISVRG